MPASFVDTNVLLYLASETSAKADRAETIIKGGDTSISVQVLNELSNVARRKMRLTWAETRNFLALVRGLLRVHPITVEVHETGIDLAERYGLAVYDAMIVGSALHAGCDTLWSQDMQHGMLIEGRLRISNPFGAAA